MPPTPVKYFAITLTHWHKLCNMETTFSKYQSIEDTINQVAQCPCKNKRTAYYKPFMVVTYYKPFQQEETKHYCNKPEQSEYQLACSSLAQFHAKGHAFIFNKMKPEPCAQHIYFLSVIEIRFYVKLTELVNDDNQQDNYYGVTVFHNIQICKGQR